MRFSRSVVAGALCLSCSIAGLRAQSPLSVPREVLTGDLVAVTLSEFFKLADTGAGASVVLYDSAQDIVEVLIYGDPGWNSAVDVARRVIGQYISVVEAAYSSGFLARFGSDVDERYCRISYYNVSVSGRPLVLSYVGGQYVLP
jgi:hypothetical protein